MLDANLILLAQAAITETTTGSEVDFGGPDVKPLVYVARVTVFTGTSLDVKIQEADTSGGTYRDTVVFKQITAAGEYFVTAKLDGRYRKVVCTVVGTSINVGVAPDLAGRYDKF
jgi:hypothetical protein